MCGEDMDNFWNEGMVDKASRYSPIITAVAATVIAGSILMGVRVIDQIQDEVSVLRTDMAWVKQSVGNIYTEDDAERDLTPIRQQISDHASRLDDYSIRLRDVEQKQERR